MSIKINNYIKILFFLGVVSTLMGCATSYIEDVKTPKANDILKQSPIRFPPYDGPKLIVAVLPLGLSKMAAQRYPHLLKKSVGLGVHNRVVEALYDTGRFRLVEEKRDIIKEVMDRQWMSSAGMVDEATAISLGKMLGAQKVIYGELYDYAEGGEKVVGLSSQSRFMIRVGVQVRLVDVETLEYVPASGVGFGLDVGSASNRAIRKAVYALIKRLD